MADPLNPLTMAWQSLPPNVRKTYASGVNALMELSPGAAIRDMLDESGRAGNALLAGNVGEAALGYGGMLAAGLGVLPAGRIAKPIKAYHASPHTFDRFDATRIGTGEGTQMEGKGLYFSSIPEGAEGYRAPYMLHRSDVPLGTRHPGPGNMYEVNLHADPARMLDLGTAKGQATYRGFIDDYVRKNLPANVEAMAPDEIGKLFKKLEFEGATALGQSGTPGAIYRPGSAAFEKTGPYNNYVMFPGTEDMIEVLKRY